jgi:hypothetical protein
MHKITKYVLGGLLILSGLGFLFNGSFLGGLLIILVGLALLPPVSEKNKEKYPFWRKNIIRRSMLGFLVIVGFGIAGSQMSSKSDYKEPNTKKTSRLLYQKYQDEVKSKVTSLSQEELAIRKEKLELLKNNSVYKKLVDSSVVSVEYLPVINAISNGMTFINSDGFNIDETLVKRVEKSENGEDKVQFIINTILIAQPQKGGLTNNLISVFERYKNKYKYYGEPSILYGLDGKQQEKIAYNYDLSSIFGVLNPDNKDVLNAIYEAKQKEFSVWNDDDTEYIYNYIATSKGYNKYVKKVYPKSPYVINADIEILATKLFSDYEANEISADEKYKNKKIAVTGIIEDIGNDIMDDPYVSLKVDILQNVNCYFDDENKKVISKLKKGQKITIIGNCKGKSLNIMVRLSDCKIWQ